jgi:hypothetical protein
MLANEHIKIGSNSYEIVKSFKYLGSLVTNLTFTQRRGTAADKSYDIVRSQSHTQVISLHLCKQ